MLILRIDAILAKNSFSDVQFSRVFLAKDFIVDVGQQSSFVNMPSQKYLVLLLI